MLCVRMYLQLEFRSRLLDLAYKQDIFSNAVMLF